MAFSLTVARQARAQDFGATLDSALEWGRDAFETYMPEEIKSEFRFPEPTDVEAFWSALNHALASQDIGALAALRPYAGYLLNALGQFEGGAMYADWLQQRLDYLDVAWSVLQAFDPTASSAPEERRGAAHRPVETWKPAQRAHPSVLPEHAKRRGLALAGQRARWTQTLAGRPAPARAAELVPRLKSVFRAEGIPPEWVWIAEVESSFNAAARSPVGAVGLFQFMPATAARFGLQTEPEDERTDPIKNARAAARYLRLLYGRFGSWPLTLAAYNAGQGRVGRLVKETENATFEAIQNRLPAETQMYVPKVLATVTLREGVEASRLPPPSSPVPTGVSASLFR